MKKAILCIIIGLLALPMSHAARVYNLADYGITPDADSLASRMARALQTIRHDAAGTPVTVKLAKGIYHMSPADAPVHTYYITNHDQVVHHPTAIALEDWQGLTLDGCGSTIMCTGRMLPMSIVRCTNVSVKRLTIDFDNPHIAQVTITGNTPQGISFEPSPEVNWFIDDGRTFMARGRKWECNYYTGIAFEGDTRHIVPQTSDLSIDLRNCSANGNIITAPQWTDSRLTPGTVVALRSYYRPHPAIFLEADTRTSLQNITIHYAEGMGVVAQRCTHLHLNKVDVRTAPGRYFTTQADATHFVGCRGKLVVENGLYESMMDDAINVHGVYLRVRERISPNTVKARYEHNQSFGYQWGEKGDTVTFVRSATMDALPGFAVISSIEPAQGTIAGEKDFIIAFDRPLPEEIDATQGYGLENITWTPEVTFRRCTVRNNRARGALFSSPRTTVCERNTFFHTSGTAILLCGDCNGWYESGAVRNLVIKKNRFINSLTNMFQFTNAVISIYPEIPNLNDAKGYFHGGTPNAIRIVDNTFETFDHPLIYAKSVDGLLVKGNKVTYNNAYKPFHWNKKSVLLEHCTRTQVQDFAPLPAN
ncbi:MAG: alpha-1,3-galactosidase B [Muribaculaceae bacterium]